MTVVFSDKPIQEKTFRIECGVASITLKENGDILVNDRLAENDKDVVDGLRQLLEFFRVHEVHNS